MGQSVFNPSTGIYDRQQAYNQTTPIDTFYPNHIYDPTVGYTPGALAYQDWLQFNGSNYRPDVGLARGPFGQRPPLGAYYDSSSRFSLYHPSMDGAGIRTSLAPTHEQLRRILGYSPSLAQTDSPFTHHGREPHYDYASRQPMAMQPAYDSLNSRFPTTLQYEDPKTIAAVNQWFVKDIYQPRNLTDFDSSPNLRQEFNESDSKLEHNNLVRKLSRGLRPRWWRSRTSS
jgi:hypothetical protein